ncbi:hypothetical protein [Nostoc sp. FACHB-888]|uniref:hypothetical protein n=1 Tax=Nostoc sp. FACHB-888 TaxID=2692842 RepID=UPI001686B422|nr:hypothetical protein [Nostoc sp. FACHB-888]MBD2249312.1 hypothetical protein [Nostoc sp. FACHB-888]
MKELVQISPLLPCSPAGLHPAILGWQTTRVSAPGSNGQLRFAERTNSRKDAEPP